MASPEQLRDDIIRLSNDFGGSEEYSRAGGGNASYKHDGILHIKPSGVPLATLGAEDLVQLRIPVLLDALHSDAPVEGDPVMAAAAAAKIGESTRRPSVEILFHALIEDSLVLHVHPLVANAVTCNEQGPQLTADLLGDEAVWVDYIDPGVPLARSIERAREEFGQRTGKPAPSITMMGNHGIIVSGNSHDEVAERMQWLTTTIQTAIDAAPESPTSRAPEADLTTVAEEFRRALGAESVALRDSGVARDSSGPEAGPVSRGPLIPDQIVYSGSLPVVLEGPNAAELSDRLATFRDTHGKDPIVCVVPGRGVIAVGKNDKAAETALETYLDALRVARDADRLGSVRVMTGSERHFIENWEAEAYRRQVADS